MTTPHTTSEAPGSTTPGASAATNFIGITNTMFAMQQLATDVRGNEPGTAEVIMAFTDNIAGQALGLIKEWPA